MSLRHWLQMFVTAGSLACGVQITGSLSALAQPPAPPTSDTPATAAPSDVPRLPDVNVVAEPPPPVPNLQPNFEPFDRNTPAGDNVFTSAPFSGYRADSSSVGALINVPDLRFPGTVNVIGKDLLNDQQALRFRNCWTRASNY